MSVVKREEGLGGWELENPRELVGGLKPELESPAVCPTGALLTEVEETSAADEFGEYPKFLDMND